MGQADARQVGQMRVQGFFYWFFYQQYDALARPALAEPAQVE